jgi:ABC-2 type transport system ATP-binding protein
VTPNLEARALRKRYDGRLAVDDLSLAVPAGSVVGLLGPNGAGKTTTIRMIMDIVAPDAGEVRFFGRPRDADTPRRIGYLPEERGLYKKMSVTDQLVFLGELRGLGRREAGRAAAHWLERFGLGDRARSKVEELSKGMQQKIQLAGTVLHDPDVLILDEPFSGLDPINQGLFREVLHEYRQAGRSVLLSTHVMEHAEKLCDTIQLVSRGRAVLTGSLAELKRRFGGNCYRVVARGDLQKAAGLPDVERCAVDGAAARLVLRPEADGAAVLRELVSLLDVVEFSAEEPDLEEIFVRALGDAA